MINASCHFLVDVDRIFAVVSLWSLKLNADDEIYENHLLKSVLDVCKIYEVEPKNSMIKSISNMLRNSSDLEAKCPFKKDKTFSLFNLQASNDIIPSYFSANSYRFKIEIMWKGSVFSAIGLSYLFRNTFIIEYTADHTVE